MPKTFSALRFLRVTSARRLCNKRTEQRIFVHRIVVIIHNARFAELAKPQERLLE